MAVKYQYAAMPFDLLRKIVNNLNDAHLRLLGVLTTGKRFSSHVTELMFESYFSVRFTEKAAFGTIKISGRQTNYNNHFYCFVDSAEEYPKALVALASKAKVQVFIVSSPCNSCAEFNNGRLTLNPSLSFEVSVLSETGQLTPSIEQTNGLNLQFAQHISDFDLTDKSDFDIGVYLGSVNDDQLRKLIFNRLLLDVVFKNLYPVDIDVIDIRKKGLVFYEFKRKTPARNLVSLNSHIRSEFDLRKVQRELNSKIPSIDSSRSYSDNFRFLAKEIGGNLEKEECFSLDYSHVLNMFLCKELCIRYVYIVWERETAEVSNLITKELMPLHEDCFLTLMPSEIDGITFTFPKDSGDVGERGRDNIRRPRFQYVFKKSRFKPVSRLD
jgi:hypothetical protein